MALEMLGFIAYVALHVISFAATWICGILIIVILVMGIIAKALPIDVLITTIVTILFTSWMLVAKVPMAVLLTEFDAEESESKCVPHIIEFIVNCVTLALWFTVAVLDSRFLSAGTFSCSGGGFSGDYCKVHQALRVLSYLNGSIYATLNFFLLVIPLTKCILRGCTRVQQTPNPLHRGSTTHRDPQSHTRVRQDPQPPPRIYCDPQGAHADGPDPQPLPRSGDPKYGDGRAASPSTLTPNPV